MSPRLLGSAELAKRWLVSQKTVLAWSASGALASLRTPTGQLRVDPAAAAAFALKRGLGACKGARIMCIGAEPPKWLRALLPERRLLHWEPQPYFALVRIPRSFCQAALVSAALIDSALLVAALHEQTPALPIAVLHGKRLLRGAKRSPDGAAAGFLETERNELKLWIDSVLDVAL